MSIRGNRSSNSSLNIKDSDCVSISSNGTCALREGSVRMTSLRTLLTHTRYLFLYHDSIVISKQKSVCSYKLKEKQSLEKVWVASSNSPDSFLIGWPLVNYLLHFRSCEEKEDWYETLCCSVQQCLRPLSSVISMHINVPGRQQTIKWEIENGKKSGEVVVEVASHLGLPHTSYELKLVVGEGAGKTLQGPENVYVVVMHEIARRSIRLSETEKKQLHTCAIAECRLVLSTLQTTKASPMQIMNNLRKRVLQRGENRGIFGQPLCGRAPPQTIISLVQYLDMHAVETEGIFRKSPKQTSSKELRMQLDQGVVPDFKIYGTHVLASVLKEYLRSIPGKILLSGNYDMWMRDVVDESDNEKKISSCKNLLSLLPTANGILLTNVLKLLNKIASAPTSKMTASSLAVCLAPSFLDCNDPIEGGKKIPPLVEFLIENASEIIATFTVDNTTACMQTSMSCPVFACDVQLDQNANMYIEGAHIDQEQVTPHIQEMQDDGDGNARQDDQGRQAKEPVPYEVFSFSSDEDDYDWNDQNFMHSTPSLATSTPRLDSAHAKECDRDKLEKISSISEEKKDTPRSPCLKRIHFQRTEAQHRSNEAFSYSSRLDFNFDKPSSRETTLKFDEVPSRKESKEESTQTKDCGLPMLQSHRLIEESQRFPAFQATAQQLCAGPDLNAIPSDPVPTQELQSQAQESKLEPLKSISERLASLRQSMAEDALHSPSQPVHSTRDCRTPEYNYQQRYVADVTPPSTPNVKMITEKFASYCIEPTIVPDTRQNVKKNTVVHRALSQRDSERPPPSPLQRASSTKARRCVGMDTVEINWSVSQLRNCFHTSKAPSINTSYMP